MSKFKIIFMAFCMLLFLYPVEVNASESQSQYFNVDIDYGDHGCIAPNDTFIETFTIQNKTTEVIKVRVYDVSNIDNSILYSVLQAGWINEDGNTNLGSFDDLVTDWYSIKSGESLEMNLEMYFPKELGNEFQGAKLSAQFSFECKSAEGKKVEISTTGSNPGGDSEDDSPTVIVETPATFLNGIPVTADNSNIGTFSVMGSLAACGIILLRFSNKHKKGRQM